MKPSTYTIFRFSSNQLRQKSYDIFIFDTTSGVNMAPKFTLCTHHFQMNYPFSFECNESFLEKMEYWSFAIDNQLRFPVLLKWK